MRVPLALCMLAAASTRCLGAPTAASTNATHSTTSLGDCEQAFAAKAQQLSGTFLRADQIIDFEQQSYDMYVNAGKSIEQIVDYYVANYRDIGLDADQIDLATSVFMNVRDILGGDTALIELYNKTMSLSLKFIAKDKAEVDALIAKNKESGAADGALNVCHQVLGMLTAEKKIQLEKQLFALVPASKLAAIKTEARRVGKLLTDNADH